MRPFATFYQIHPAQKPYLSLENWFCCQRQDFFYFSFQINSSELDAALDAAATPVNMQPEIFKPVFHKLRKKEKSLRMKAQELENKLEMSEIHNYSLVEENCELKTEIESLETEISEVNMV